MQSAFLCQKQLPLGNQVNETRSEHVRHRVNQYNREQVLDELVVGHIVEQTEEDTDDERRSHALVGVERSADNRREYQRAPLVLLLYSAEQAEEIELLIERVQQRVNNRDLGERRKLREYREQVDVAQALRREVVVAVVEDQIQNVCAEAHDDEEH